MDEFKIKTSVIVPVYNVEKYLDTCLQSVLRQSQKELELIFVDDGSTDGSARLIDEYALRYPFVRAIHQENKKLGAARNAGVQQAKGKYIYFLDADDFIDENLLDACYEMAERDLLDFVMFDAVSFLDGMDMDKKALEYEVYDRRGMGIKGIFSGRTFWRRYYESGAVFGNACLHYINTGFLRENKIYFEPGIFYEDMEWGLRMYLRARRIAYLPAQAYHRRIRPQSIMTSKYGETHLNSCIFICRKIFGALCLADQEESEMITAVLTAMLWRTRHIIQTYQTDGITIHVSTRLQDLYQCLITSEEIGKISSDVGILILSLLNMIEDTLTKYGSNGIEKNLPASWLEALRKELTIYPLQAGEQTVGIFGTGAVCPKLLKLYEKYVGEITARVFFLDSFKESGGTFRGFPLYNLKDLDVNSLDSIIIASTRHRENMKAEIEALGVDKNKIICIQESLYGFL